MGSLPGAAKVLPYEGRLPMPARNPRVSVVLERPLYERLQALAQREGVSVSSVVRDLGP